MVRNKGTNLSPQEKQQIKDGAHGNGMKLVKSCLMLDVALQFLVDASG